jgi:hypothetical protein
VEVKSCRVTISDMEGIAHTVEVTAATLYEVVALGLKQIRGNDWIEGIAGALNPVQHFRLFPHWLRKLYTDGYH